MTKTIIETRKPTIFVHNQQSLFAFFPQLTQIFDGKARELRREYRKERSQGGREGKPPRDLIRKSVRFPWPEIRTTLSAGTIPLLRSLSFKGHFAVKRRFSIKENIFNNSFVLSPPLFVCGLLTLLLTVRKCFLLFTLKIRNLGRNNTLFLSLSYWISQF
jgi:hypothetical protein